MQIYLARNNQQAGPYTLEQVNQMLASQQILLTDLAWHEGMTEWKALGELTQGKLVYQPIGYSVPTINTNTSTNETIRQIRVEPKVHELASIPARALAKIIDLLLWLPIAAIPSFSLMKLNISNYSSYKNRCNLPKSHRLKLQNCNSNFYFNSNRSLAFNASLRRNYACNSSRSFNKVWSEYR